MLAHGKNIAVRIFEPGRSVASSRQPVKHPRNSLFWKFGTENIPLLR